MQIVRSVYWDALRANACSVECDAGEGRFRGVEAEREEPLPFASQTVRQKH